MEALRSMVPPDDLKLATGQTELCSGRGQRIGVSVPRCKDVCKDSLDTL